MKRFKKHIAAFLLGGLLFPQGATFLHYYVVSHGTVTENETRFIQPNPELNFHSPLFHLNSFSSILPSGDFTELPQIPGLRTVIIFFGLEHYIHQPNFHFRLRGPPIDRESLAA